jgi:hypothetical protein
MFANFRLPRAMQQNASAVAALMLQISPPDYAELFDLFLALCSDLDPPLGITRGSRIG